MNDYSKEFFAGFCVGEDDFLSGVYDPPQYLPSSYREGYMAGYYVAILSFCKNRYI